MGDLLKLVNQMITASELEVLEKSAGDVLSGLVLKLISFWLMEVPNAQQAYP